MLYNNGAGDPAEVEEIMKYTINGIEYTFTADSVGSEKVLAATYEQNGESFTIWTAEADELPESEEGAAELINNLDWEVENSRVLSSSKYGTVDFDGKTYALTQDAYPENYGTFGAVRYYASAISEDGNKYLLTWETTEAWNRANELYKLEQKTEDYCNEELTAEELARIEELRELGCADIEDEHEACDWDNPIEVVAR